MSILTAAGKNYLVLLEHLPPKAQYDYHISQFNSFQSGRTRYPVQCKGSQVSLYINMLLYFVSL